MRLDSEAAIRQHRDQIGQVAVRTRIMPPGNLTGMTDDERALLERWLNQPADPP
ncbi:hypothetical protein ASALC70_01638 [Alcanivorax sp. ALC70]|nr:hypothetical protein ASALC70_01638 [Alcanivorax sp. ALC70]